MPASRRARAMIFAPRSCPSSPGFAITTLIFRVIRASLRSDPLEREPPVGLLDERAVLGRGVVPVTRGRGRQRQAREPALRERGDREMHGARERAERSGDYLGRLQGTFAAPQAHAQGSERERCWL